ncbi:pilus assembly protein CpaE [Bisgaardia hudsonensis]|uniref:Pilus assembly protein CpaE n=1 Tax=Bisgaardia hudsonensis TaxID=109472 RepID=A0A4R2MVN5_9PAST|nr:pilus assembly protein [Bisgaardia hudsonensis]QLB12352.1 pilus assembly protein [Bisgaardia hudsonensis]TCP12401.1 pilus assembly protein CpaE [Bisgaardia hudsonensis]
MLLLDKDTSNIDNVRKVVVISESENIRNKLSQLLRSRGIENIEIISKYFFSESIALNAEETIGVIIDVANETDVLAISENVNAIVPQQVWCCLIGQSDSISLSQKLLDHSILYFNSDTQLNLMMEKIASSSITIPKTRHTVKVCVLGCKGGIGSTFISSQIANQIASYKKVPVLLAQAKNGSQNLDLLFDKKLQGDIVEYDANLDLLNNDIQILDKSALQKYNFVIYDKPIFNVDRDDFESFFEFSNTFVLVVERHVGSLRVAKQFLDQCNRTQKNTGQPIRSFICISDSNQEHSQLMAKSDIETLLNSRVDAVIPFIKKTTAKNVLEVKLSRSQVKVLHDLAMKIIGVLSRQAKKEKKSLFKSFIQKLMAD